jgi:hypothetical protein
MLILVPAGVPFVIAATISRNLKIAVLWASTRRSARGLIFSGSGRRDGRRRSNSDMAASPVITPQAIDIGPAVGDLY